VQQQHGRFAAFSDQVFGAGSNAGPHLLLGNHCMGSSREYRYQQAE
jgi:hypothetical protein